MKTFKLLLLSGDGIGPEVMNEVEKLIQFYRKEGIVDFNIEKGLVGGASFDAHNVAITDETIKTAQDADAVFLACVGGPKWSKVPYEERPEAGLLRLRKELELFANLRPALCYPALAEASALKKHLVEGLDILIVRELTGGVYFGEPKEIVTLQNGEKRAIDTQIYTSHEIERIAHVAFDLAEKRSGKVASAEKHNVMHTGVLWKEIVTEIGTLHPQVSLQHILADNLGMQLVRNPKQFDVIVTDNLFGDILSDVAAMLTGSLGMLPSASLGTIDPISGRSHALYEPVHGSAPDISGQGIANPIAMLGSVAMSLRYSFDMVDEADRLERAISSVLERKFRTADIYSDGMQKISTSQMGDAVLQELEKLLQFRD